LTGYKSQNINLTINQFTYSYSMTFVQHDFIRFAYLVIEKYFSFTTVGERGDFPSYCKGSFQHRYLFKFHPKYVTVSKCLYGG